MTNRLKPTWDSSVRPVPSTLPLSSNCLREINRHCYTGGMFLYLVRLPPSSDSHDAPKVNARSKYRNRRERFTGLICIQGCTGKTEYLSLLFHMVSWCRDWYLINTTFQRKNVAFIGQFCMNEIKKEDGGNIEWGSTFWNEWIHATL